MKFERLSVSNLRAVRHFAVEDLGDFIVIAGANGSGKSCILDAIRLLKSVYGGYQVNEYHHWFGEFAINVQDRNSLRKLFRDPDRPITISASLRFADSERTYLLENAESVVQALAWQELGQPVDPWSYSPMAFLQVRHLQPQVLESTQRLATEVRAALANELQQLSLTIFPGGAMEVAPCRPAEAAFQAYEPEKLGVIEYHSASRSYARQQVGGINLDTRSFEDQRRQQGLYNWQGKYQNVKSELATSYLRGLIARESTDVDGSPTEEDLNETLKELFRTFFPDKEYLGVRPQAQGALEFPVRVKTGEEHDIDELSSGEKEILYGYLRLRNSTPANSVLLLDEPELHLNPSLLQGFTDFYYRHLGLAQNNQLWLITHSDTLLRQAVGNINYRVYQMVPASALEGRDNQASEVVADDDVERVTIDLVGDLASYRPHGRVVVLEGTAENGFDVNVVRRLFPDFARRVNLVSGGHKQRVRDLYRLLERADLQAAVKRRFFAIVDKDASAQLPVEAGTSEFSWDVYHIENYLLEPGSLRSALETLTQETRYSTDEEVLAALKACATDLVDRLVSERMQQELNDRLIQAINIGGRPDSRSPATELIGSVEGTRRRLQAAMEGMRLADLTALEGSIRDKLERAVEQDLWLQEFPGRSILRRFADRELRGKLDTGMFFNLILDKMVERDVQPAGMKAILDRILAAA